MNQIEFNQMSEDISLLEHQLLELGESEEYIVALKFGYIQTYPNDEEKVIKLYYEHLLDIKRMKYD